MAPMDADDAILAGKLCRSHATKRLHQSYAVGANSLQGGAAKSLPSSWRLHKVSKDCPDNLRVIRLAL